jgi:hypothetical protein
MALMIVDFSSSSLNCPQVFKWLVRVVRAEGTRVGVVAKENARNGKPHGRNKHREETRRQEARCQEEHQV